jgi:hypothetical protein
MKIDRYNNITKIQKYKFSNQTITAFLPSPTESDYSIGYIRRYFIQNVVDKSSPIYEVSDVEFSRILTLPNYTGVSLKWRITGPISQTFTNSVIDKGVRESNRISISLVNDKIPNLKFYLPNLLQFHK